MAGKRDEVTIAEVAEALNISKTTVSRAISGKGRVSEATRARVFDYIGKGRQDAAAPLRTAQQGPTNNLALVIPKHFMRLDLPFLRKCMGGVWNMAAQRGYDLLLCYAGETDVGQLERQLESHKVDGVILSRTMLHDECVQTLQRHNVPFVAIGRVDDDKVPQVDNDQVGATAEMTRLLLQLGISQIYLSNISCKACLGRKPTLRADSWPFFSTTRQGMLEMPYSVASWRFSSTSML